MGACAADCLSHNALNRSRNIGIFTTVAAVFSVTTLTWRVVSDSQQGETLPDSEPLIQTALDEQRVIGVVALVVNIGWLVVGALLVVAVKMLSPRLTVPFLVWAALYLPFCLAVAGVCLRRLILLSAAGLGQPLLLQLTGSAVLCLLAGPLYTLLMLVVAAARRQMLRDGPGASETRRLAKDTSVR